MRESSFKHEMETAKRINKFQDDTFMSQSHAISILLGLCAQGKKETNFPMNIRTLHLLKCGDKH